MNSEEEVIDNVLKWMFSKHVSEDLEVYCLRELNIKDAKFDHLHTRMADEGVVKRITRHSSIITSKGREIVRNGGYLQHLKRIEEDKDQEAKRLQLEKELAESTLKLNRFNIWGFWFNGVLGAINVALAIWQILKATN